jgi:hypothetical protein
MAERASTDRPHNGHIGQRNLGARQKWSKTVVGAAVTDHFCGRVTKQRRLADLGTTGDTVAVSVQATQCDGTVNQYQGTYTVQNGLITAADVQQTG